MRRRLQQTPQHLKHVAAARFLRIHGLADHVQLRGLPRAETRSASGAREQVEQEIAPATQFPRAATGEVENHRVRNQSGFQCLDAFLKSHRT